MTPKPLVAVSTCLLGKRVRYDGAHKRDRIVCGILAKRLRFLPICPETECGFGVPRPAVRIVEKRGRLRILTEEGGLDRTPKLAAWIRRKIRALARLPIRGFILKARSPSCAVRSAKICGRKGAIRRGSGLFAAAVRAAFPGLPCEESERLADPRRRRAFLARVLAAARGSERGSHPPCGATRTRLR